MNAQKLIVLFLLFSLMAGLFACANNTAVESGLAGNGPDGSIPENHSSPTPGGDPTNWMLGHENDAAVIAGIYPVSEDNPYLVASYEEAVRLFKQGTGILVFGFPDCPRCRNVLPALEKAFKEMGMDQHDGFTGRILYYNIYDDREANNERYQALVEYTKEFLTDGDDGNPRIFSPDVFFVNAGKIVGNHLDTVPSLTNPLDKLNEEQEAELIGIYKDLIAIMEECRC